MPTLLLADDSVTVQRVIALTFAAEDIRVVTVSDGRQAVDRMKTLHPDIVLAGTLLPQVSGYDLAKHMRSIPGLKNVPVLLLTGAFETVDQEQLKASGANGILEKPVEPNHVIARVKELLGLKSEPKPAMAGRVGVADDSDDKQIMPPSAPPRVVTATRASPSQAQQLRDRSGLDSDPTSVEVASTRPDDYLDTLDAAFDTLDQQLSGHEATTKPSRNPSGPLGQSSGAPDPRSPGRRPQGGAAAPGNPVFEVDDEWFGAEDSAARAAARAGRREIQEDLRDPGLQAPAPEGAPNPIFEVDEAWFAEDDKARAAKADEQRMLAAEMGIYDVELPAAPAAPDTPAPASDRDFDFGIDDFKAVAASEPAPAIPVASEVVEAEPLLSAIAAPPIEPVPAIDPVPSIDPVPPSEPAASSSPQVAADFAQLLAFEQGEHPVPPMPPAPEIRVVAPEVTDQMLEQIATRVADRLGAGVFADQLKEAMMTTVRETVRVVAYETSERIVREIAVESTERIVRDVATDAAGRLMSDVASATSERIVREAAEASERIAHDVAFQASERIVRDVAAETSQRIAREVASDTSQQIVRAIVAETSERLVRDEIERIKSKHQ